MQQTKAYRSPITGMLPAVLLCMAVMLAMVGGSLINSVPLVSAATDPASGQMDVRGRSTGPAIPERSFVVVDWRSAKAMPQHDDGKSALIPAGVEMSTTAIARPRSDLVLRANVRPSGPTYGARAPPAFS
ncbi:hypothetical protein J1C56_15585 [Aminobacter anthyllidis]|uniref:Uncharacterized protein n=1 Tax=Aminobacter anthyllidis TaxID=1035067 RepID=A0A9X1D4Q6_9HYPH|nr:hypothetical protein [Aminobacter anthyllidis]MBT1157020.1 hypothetical protein [Aminobacter anthyllidis]